MMSIEVEAHDHVPGKLPGSPIRMPRFPIPGGERMGVRFSGHQLPVSGLSRCSSQWEAAAC